MKIILLIAGLAFLTFKNQAQTVTDIDGNIYNSVTIGTQAWMKENLKVTHYRDGTLIPNVTSATLWISLSTGARCYYNNDSVVNAPVYGALYNLFAVDDSRNICPIGWHVPSDGEWNIMEKYLDNTVDTTATGYVGTDIGGKLKETGTTHWTSPNTGATNNSGFGALPGGTRSNDGAYYYVGDYGYGWSAMAYDATNAWYRYLCYDNSQVGRDYNSMVNGFSIRCVRDIATQINEIKNKFEIEIYPNPATDRVFINITERQDIKMQVYNIFGECALQLEMNNGTNDIDVSSLSKGIYVIQITGADKTIQQKLIKD
jgi:uncharacterized protein (TIGR02145 family)